MFRIFLSSCFGVDLRWCTCLQLQFCCVCSNNCLLIAAMLSMLLMTRRVRPARIGWQTWCWYKNMLVLVQVTVFLARIIFLFFLLCVIWLLWLGSVVFFCIKKSVIYELRGGWHFYLIVAIALQILAIFIISRLSICRMTRAYCDKMAKASIVRVQGSVAHYVKILCVMFDDKIRNGSSKHLCLNFSRHKSYVLLRHHNDVYDAHLYIFWCIFHVGIQKEWNGEAATCVTDAAADCDLLPEYDNDADEDVNEDAKVCWEISVHFHICQCWSSLALVVPVLRAVNWSSHSQSTELTASKNIYTQHKKNNSH